MFGEKPGDERFKGPLNQYVVSKLTGVKRSYYVMHTRGEDPTSILITALTRMKTPGDELLALGSDITECRTFTAAEWLTVSCREVLAWGVADKKVFLHEELKGSAATSRVLGYEKEKDDADA